MFDLKNLKERLYDAYELKEEYVSCQIKIERYEPYKALRNFFILLFVSIILGVIFALAGGFDESESAPAALAWVLVFFIPALINLIIYLVNIFSININKRKMDRLIKDYEYIKKQFKNELLKIEKDIKNKSFFENMCENIAEKFFNDYNVEKHISEKRNVYVYEKVFEWQCCYCGLLEREGYQYRAPSYIYNFVENGVHNLPNIFYIYALANAIEKRSKTIITEKIDQTPEKYVNYNLFLSKESSIDSFLTSSIGKYSFGHAHTSTEFEELIEKDFHVYKTIKCTIKLTYDGDKTHEKW